MYSEYTTSQLNDSFSPESPIFPCISPYLEESVVSADYWKVKLDGDGNVVEVLDDGDPNTITFVGEDGKVKSVHIAAGSLSGQIADLAGAYQTGDNKQSKSDVNNIMVDSGLDYATGLGWHATRPDAYDYGSGYDPVYEAIKNGNYYEIQNVILNMGKNSETDISQEMVEQALGLAEHSACAITAGSEMTNNFFQEQYGDSFNNSELIEAIGKAQGEMFDNESTVQSWNGLNAAIAAEFGLDNYLLFYKEDSLEALQADGIKYYLKKFVDVEDSSHTHFGSSSNGILDDPDTTTGDRWWEDSDLYTPVYYGFKPKY